MNNTTEGKLNAVYFPNEMRKPRSNIIDGNFIGVDSWYPTGIDDTIVNCIPGFFVAPISVINNVAVDPNQKFDFFMLGTKKCYNSAAMRTHLYQYINYFCNFYDYDKEYLSILYILKMKMERYSGDYYNTDMFFADMERYILKSNIGDMVGQMVEDNYMQKLNYTNFKAPSLRYDDEDAKLLHKMSILMDLCIPLLTNFAYMHRVDNIDDYLLTFYDKIFDINPNINMYEKLYNTAFTNVSSSQRGNIGIWVKQDIRGIDAATHSTDSVTNIILNIMPKYVFKMNIVSFNFASIRKNTSYKITDISFEFSYVSISSSKRDNESISDFDKFESNLIRSNEALYIQNKINCAEVMKTIEAKFGPFDPAEIALYNDTVLKDKNGEYTINSFQKQLVFDLFYKNFRDTVSIYAINRHQFIELIIAAKKLLRSKNMIILPYIIAGKVEKLVTRKTVNKKERLAVESSPTYPLLQAKYKNSEITDTILSIIATIISSDFSIVDMDPEINGKRLDTRASNIIIEEVETYIHMC